MGGGGRNLSSARCRLSSIGSTRLFIDARIPVQFLACLPDHPLAERVLLLSPSVAREHPGWMKVVCLPAVTNQDSRTTTHGSGCACCTGRSEQARALTLLFQERAKGSVGFFKGVVAVLLPQEAALLRDLLQSDAFLSGCYVTADTGLEYQD